MTMKRAWPCSTTDYPVAEINAETWWEARCIAAEFLEADWHDVQVVTDPPPFDDWPEPEPVAIPRQKPVSPAPGGVGGAEKRSGISAHARTSRRRAKGRQGAEGRR